MDAKKKELPKFIRRDVERAIEAATRPSGMSVHDGKAFIGADVLQYILNFIDQAALAQPAQGEAVAYLWEDTSFHKGDRPRGVFIGKPTVQTLTNKNIRLTNLYEAIATGEAVEALKAIADGEGEAQEIARQTLSSLELASPQPPADIIAVPRSEWESMKRDAERYRYIRMPHVGFWNVHKWDQKVMRYVECLGHQLDVEIDAAKSTGEDV